MGKTSRKKDLYEEQFLPDSTVYQSIPIDHIVSDKLETGTIQYKLVPVNSKEKLVYFIINIFQHTFFF